MMKPSEKHSNRPIVLTGIITFLYAFFPLVSACLKGDAAIQVMDTGIMVLPNGLYCLFALTSGHLAAVFALCLLWLLLWGICYLLIRLWRRSPKASRDNSKS